ncbi:RND family efflux transporter MFP subunit [Thermoflavifilum aggregans]|uniref:RND family efflux transporter MFP subunit n=2 Tax=Thermoflavifilum aggregans TaxID=454188 RepID=A0A2M9CRF5_9BACT|nr:RND family efflux transporter MFP subunit [Thermoflavifilum aggregans]
MIFTQKMFGMISRSFSVSLIGFGCIAMAMIVLPACNARTDKQASNQEKLQKLLQERDRINQEIQALQQSIAPAQQKVVSVSVIRLSPEVFKTYIEVQGHVDAQQNVNVNPEISGVVTAIYVQVGQWVKRGQVLAQLDDKVIRQQLAQLETQLDFTKNLYERQKNLWAQKIGTEVQLLQAKNNYENVQKQIAVVQSQLSMYRLVSPIDGRVDEVDLKIGQAVSPGMNTIRVVNLNDLRVKGQIAESYIGQVHQGDPVEVIFPDASDTLHTRLSYVSSVIDPNSRSFNIEIKLPAHSIFRPNMVAVIRVVSYVNPQAIVVPVNVVQHTETGDYVFVAEDNYAKEVKITKGKTYNDRVEVLQGLKPGDTLIINGYQDLADHVPVQIVQ